MLYIGYLIIVNGQSIQKIGFRNLIAFGKAPRREADSQPISQSDRQVVSKVVGRASRQTRRQKHTVWLFFSHRLHIQTVGNPSCTNAIGHPLVEHSPFASKVGGSNPGRRLPARADRPIVLFHPTLVQILLTTNF